MTGKKYHTRQYEELLNYLRNKQGEHVVVKKIYDYFKKSNINMGVATIYRHLDAMVKDGIVRKYVVDSNTSACFEFVEKKECCLQNNHIHLKCLKCGLLEHLDCDAFGKLVEHIGREHAFNVDLRRIVLYGICSNCKTRGRV